MKLYYFPPSPNSRKAHIVAVYLELPLELKFVDIQKGEQYTPEFLQLNPTGRTPVLQDGNWVIWESAAIMQYLASQVPNSLWPDNVKIRTEITRWQSWELVHWGPACQSLQYEKFVKQILQEGDPDPQIVERATKAFHKEATVLNNHLAKHKFLVNNTLTLADFAVACDLTYAVPAGVPLETYSNIRNWYALIEQLPAWQKTASQA